MNGSIDRRRERIHEAAVRPVSSASAAVFRMAFGVAMVVNVALYLPVLVDAYYTDTTAHFPYGPLTFVPALPRPGMHLVYLAMGVTGVLIAVGRWYRPAAWSFFALTTYVFLIDSSYFQNHEYLVSLLALLLALLPVDRRWAMDLRAHPERASPTVPAWVVWLLRFQIGIPYFFGGVAKLNADWLRGEPLRAWLAARTDIGPIDAILTDANVVWVMTYGALVLDLAVVPLLLWRRTRLPAFVVITGFHLLNAWLFGLFIFPWLMIAATTIFFAPDWPERLLTRWRSGSRTGAELIADRHPSRSGRTTPMRPLLVGALAIWVVVQLTLPLRHYAIDGSPNWTEQGHRFAWHMKLRDKSGTATFHVGQAGSAVPVDPADHLGTHQLNRLAGHPERLVHFARHLSALHDGAEVRVDTSVSLNGRRPQPIVDPDVDLASVPLVGWGRRPWILPMEEPLHPGSEGATG